MNIKPSWDSTPQKQQSPLEEVGNDARLSIIEALEEYTVPLFNNNPLHGAMVKMMGGCSVEIRRSVIENATQYGESDDNALYGLAVFDLFDENLQPIGAVFTNPTIEGFKDIVFGRGGLYFNRSKLNELPLLVTDDIHLAFKTTYPVYAPYSDSKIKAYALKALMKAHPDLYVIAPVHQQDDIQRRYTDLNVKMAFIPEPPNFAMSQNELDSMIKVAIKGANSTTQKPTAWGELLPLQQEESVASNPYPIDALPLLAREAVLAISEYVQSPIAMTAQCVIGAMSHIAQAKVNAPDRFKAHGEPCSLFLLTEGQSGSRKSTSKNLADRAILEYERNQYEIYRTELEQWKSGQAGLPKKDREAYCAENPPPNDPSTLYSDITLESIAGLFIDGILQNASISSDEAGLFFGGHTMKADTRNQALGGYTKLFDDGYVERTRSKSNLNGSGRAHDVRVTFNLQGQREVLDNALKDPVLRGQGFLPRFILTIPENLAGTRLQNAAYRNKNANKDHRLIAYWTRCESLLDSCPQVQTEHELHNGRYVIPMNEEAIAIDTEFYNVIESLQRVGKRFEYLQAFASRASQLARRLATVFAYFEGLQQIDGKTLQGACEVVKHSLNEWAMYAEIEVKAESDAEKLIKWIVGKCVQQKTDRLTYSYIQTSCPRPMQKNKNLLEMVIQQLEDSNHIKIESLGRTRYVVINPLLLES